VDEDMMEIAARSLASGGRLRRDVEKRRRVELKRKLRKM
jgi:hypothetical protein